MPNRTKLKIVSFMMSKIKKQLHFLLDRKASHCEVKPFQFFFSFWVVQYGTSNVIPL